MAPECAQDRSLFELQSIHPGKMHAVVASDESEAIQIAADDVMKQKYLPRLVAHPEKCESQTYGRHDEAISDFILEQQLDVYKHRQIRQVMKTDQEVGMIGRNVDPVPSVEEMN